MENAQQSKTPIKYIGGRDIEQALANLEISFSRNVSNSNAQIEKGNLRAARTFDNNARGDYLLLESRSDKCPEYVDKLQALETKLGMRLTQ